MTQPKLWTPTNLAYAAGIVDADGYIGITRTRIEGRRTQYVGRLAVNQVNPAAVILLSEMFGGTLTRRHPPAHAANNCRPQWAWSRQGKSAARACRLLLPHLRIKSEQALLLVEAVKYASAERKFVIPDVDPSEPMVTTREAHELTGFTLSGVRQAALHGTIPTFRTNGHVFIPLSFIETWKTRGQQPSRRIETEIGLIRLYRRSRHLNRVGLASHEGVKTA